MKKTWFSLIVTGIVVVMVAGGLNLTSAVAQTPVQQPGDNEVLRTISVSGSGVVSAQPDTAIVVVGVRTEAEEASAALSQNNQQMANLIDTLEQAGIAQEDIQTQYINLSPRYSNQPDTSGQPQVTGYIATNTVQVRVADIDQAGELLDTLVQAGSNLIESIRFEVSDQEEALQQAREQAFSNAREKAEQLADLAGVQLGMVVSISESFSQIPRPFASGGADFAVQESVPLEPGSQNIRIDLQVAWEIGAGQSAGAEVTTTPIIPETGSDQTTTPPAASPTARATRQATVTGAAASPTVRATMAAPTESTPVDEADDTAAGQLRLEGATVRTLGTILQPFFPVVGQVLEVNGEQVQVFTFESQADAQQAVDAIMQSGESFGNLNLNFSVLPTFFHEGEIVVLYAGQDEDTLNLLTEAFGEALSLTS